MTKTNMLTKKVSSDPELELLGSKPATITCSRDQAMRFTKK